MVFTFAGARSELAWFRILPSIQLCVGWKYFQAGAASSSSGSMMSRRLMNRIRCSSDCRDECLREILGRPPAGSVRSTAGLPEHVRPALLVVDAGEDEQQVA